MHLTASKAQSTCTSEPRPFKSKLWAQLLKAKAVIYMYDGYVYAHVHVYVHMYVCKDAYV